MDPARSRADAWHSIGLSANPSWQSTPGSASERRPARGGRTALEDDVREGSGPAPSGGPHRLRLGALGAGAHLEDDLLTLGQHLVPVHVDRGVVHEHVLPATVHGDEAVALLRVEPLDDTAGHGRTAPR